MANLEKVLKEHENWLKGIGGQRADLRHANLQGSDLRHANLQGSDLRDANLQGANLRDADLQDANLQGANLRGADLRDADLQGANLRGADLRDADLRDADLQGSDLRHADLDFSCLPLWCGGLEFKIDDRIAKQLLYHIINLIQDHVKFRNEQIDFANQFHRIDEVKKIKKESE